jgi:hypothetical protein
MSIGNRPGSIAKHCIHLLVRGSTRIVRPLVGSDPVFEAQREADVVPPLQQAFAPEGIDTETDLQAGVVAERIGREVDSELVPHSGFGAPKEIVHLGLGEGDGEDSVLEAVVVEDIRVAWRDQGAKPVIEDCPRRVFAARAAAEVGAADENRRALVARPVEHEIGIRLLAFEISPVIEQHAPEALASERLEELFGHHLVGVYVDPVQDGYKAGMFVKGLQSPTSF